MFKSLFASNSSEKAAIKGDKKWKKCLAAGSSLTSPESSSDEKGNSSDITTIRRRHSFSHPYLMSALEEEQNNHDNSELSINPFDSPLLKRSKSLPFNLVKQPSISKFRRKEIKSVRFESTGKESELNNTSTNKSDNQFITISPQRSVSSEYSDSSKDNIHDFNSMSQYKKYNQNETKCFSRKKFQNIFEKDTSDNCEDDRWFERITKDSGHLNLQLMSNEKQVMNADNSIEIEPTDYESDDIEEPTTINKGEKNSDIGSIVGLLSFESNTTNNKNFNSNFDKSIMQKIVAKLSSDNPESKIDCERVDETLNFILAQTENQSNEIKKYKLEVQLKQDQLLKIKEDFDNKEKMYQKKVEELSNSSEKLQLDLNSALEQSKKYLEDLSKSKNNSNSKDMDLKNQIDALKLEKKNLSEISNKSQEQIKLLEFENNEYENVLFNIKQGLNIIVIENEEFKENNKNLIKKLSNYESVNKKLTDSINKCNEALLEKKVHIEDFNEKLNKANECILNLKNETREMWDFKERYEIQKEKYEDLLKLNKEIENNTKLEIEAVNEELRNAKLALNRAKDNYSTMDIEKEALITNMTKYSNDLRYKNSELTSELIQMKESMSELQANCDNSNKKYKELNLQNSKAYKILQYYDNRVEELTLLREKEISKMNALEESQRFLRESIIDLIRNSFECLSPVMYEETSIFFKKMLDEFMNNESFPNNDNKLTQRMICFIIDTISDLVNKFLSNKSSLEREINNRNITYDKMLDKLGRIMEENLDQTFKENDPHMMINEPKVKKLRNPSKHRRLLPRN